MTVLLNQWWCLVCAACTTRHLLLFSPQEEQESATIQVQSLLARAEELVLTLQVGGRN